MNEQDGNKRAYIELVRHRTPLTGNLCSGGHHWAGRDFVRFVSLSATSPYIIWLLPLFLLEALFPDKPFAHLTVSASAFQRTQSVNDMHPFLRPKPYEYFLILSFPSFYISNPSSRFFMITPIVLFNLISHYSLNHYTLAMLFFCSWKLFPAKAFAQAVPISLDHYFSSFSHGQIFLIHQNSIQVHCLRKTHYDYSI